MDELIEWLEERAGGLDIDAGNGVTDAESLILRQAAAALRAVREAPLAIMDTREFLSLCAPTEDDFPAIYALQGQRVRIVKEGE